MAIRQVITFKLKPGTRAAFIQGFDPIVQDVRKVDGCEQYDYYLHPERDDELLMLERWRDLASLEAALGSLKPADGDPKIAFLRHIDGAPARERYEV